MPDLKSRLWRLRHDWLPMSALVIGIGLLVVLGSDLANRGAAELRQLASSRSDNVVWTVAQTEVEFLDLQREILLVERNGGSAQAVREAFDLYYSRLAVLRNSPLYRDQIASAGETETLAWLSLRTEAMLPIIDADDATLLAATDALLAELRPMSSAYRTMASRVTQTVAQQQEALRERVFTVMSNLAVVAVLLLACIAALAVFSWRMFRFVRSRARELRQTSTRLSTIVTTSQDAIVVTDGDDRITEYNAAAEALFGRSRDEAMGQPIDMLAEVAALDGEERRRRVQGHHANGSAIPLEVSRGAERTPVGCVRVYVFRDVSHRLAIEEDLRDSRDKALEGERAKARFMAVMSHEMRTPLNGILGVIDLLRAEDGTPRMRDYLDILESSGETLLGHVNDVLDFTELDASGVSLSLNRVDIEALSHSVLRAFEPAARARGLRLERIVHLPGSPMVEGDPARLRQILNNLLDNAVKHTDRGNVTLEVSGAGPGAAPMVEIQVSDTGAGIPAEAQERIFEDFVRLDPSDGVVREGTGLGLGITRRLVEAMGGEIGVESEPGEGSLFWVRLPLPSLPAETSCDSQQPQEDHSTPVTPMRVLVVEDNPVNRFILREMLQKDGHTVFEASDGAAGVAMADKQPYDVILMDLAMPVMDGDAAVRRIRAGQGPNSGTRIIALTAHVHAAENPETRAAGFDQVVTKPVTWSGLRALLSGRVPTRAAPPFCLGEATPLMDPSGLSGLAQTLAADKRAALLRSFRNEGHELLAMMAAGDQPSDLLRRKVHSLAGAASIIGARRLQCRLSDIEAAMLRGEDAAGPDALERIFADTCAALDATGDLPDAPAGERAAARTT